MKVELVRVNNAFHFEATGAANVKIDIDGSTDIGGNNLGARPMEMLLMGLAGCSAIDVILILNKQRQVIDDLRLSVEGEREAIEGTQQSPFRKIHVTYHFKGNLDAAKVKRAIELSMEKYCSATAQFRPTTHITHSFEIEA